MRLQNLAALIPSDEREVNEACGVEAAGARASRVLKNL